MANSNSGKEDLRFQGGKGSLFGKKEVPKATKAAPKAKPAVKKVPVPADKPKKVPVPADKPTPFRGMEDISSRPGPSGPTKRYANRGPDAAELTKVPSKTQYTKADAEALIKSPGPSKRFTNTSAKASPSGPSSRYNNSPATKAAPAGNVSSSSLSNSRPASPAAPKQLTDAIYPKEIKMPAADRFVDSMGEYAKKAINSLGSTSGSMTPGKQPRRNKAGQPVPD